MRRAKLWKGRGDRECNRICKWLVKSNWILTKRKACNRGRIACKSRKTAARYPWTTKAREGKAYVNHIPQCGWHRGIPVNSHGLEIAVLQHYLGR